jgi:hypothetical protein
MVAKTAWHLIESSVSLLEESSVWIDQIYIDQSNIKEKNNPVARQRCTHSWVLTRRLNESGKRQPQCGLAIGR